MHSTTAGSNSQNRNIRLKSHCACMLHKTKKFHIVTLNCSEVIWTTVQRSRNASQVYMHELCKTFSWQLDAFSHFPTYAHADSFDSSEVIRCFVSLLIGAHREVIPGLCYWFRLPAAQAQTLTRCTGTAYHIFSHLQSDNTRFDLLRSAGEVNLTLLTIPIVTSIKVRYEGNGKIWATLQVSACKTSVRRVLVT